MNYLLDTNICIFLIKRKPSSVLARIAQHPLDELGISAVTVSELRYGVEKSSRPQRNHAALNAFLAPLVISDFNAAAAECYGEVRAELERVGTPIGPLDMMIAAHALSLRVTLVTANTAEFARVPGLKIENWAAA